MLGIKNAGWTTPFDANYGVEPELKGECRRAPRIRDNIFLFYRQSGNDFQAVEAITNNLSATGACIDVDREIPVGTELYIELYAPQDYHKKFLQTIYIKAEVVWQRPLGLSEADSQNRLGLSFTTIDKADQDSIYRYAEEGFVNRVNG